MTTKRARPMPADIPDGAIARAAEMLRVAARFTENPEIETVYYDGTECDGGCCADDCRDAANALDGKEGERGG